MFEAVINRRRSILLVCFSERLSPAAIAEGEAFTRGVAEREGPFDLVVDFSDVTEIDMPVHFIATRGEKPQICPDRDRFFVAPQPILHALLRVFAGYQALNGVRKPFVVGKLPAVFESLGTNRSEFEPLDPPHADGCAAEAASDARR